MFSTSFLQKSRRGLCGERLDAGPLSLGIAYSAAEPFGNTSIAYAESFFLIDMKSSSFLHLVWGGLGKC